MLTLSLTDERTWFRASAPMMGSSAELLIDGTADDVAHGFRRLRVLERTWSRFDPSSELNRLHGRAGEWVAISDDLMRALVWAHRMHAETNGLFDPTVRRALELMGYDRTFRSVLDSDAPAPAAPAPGLGSLEIDRERSRVRLGSGIRIDLGGIGKGLAADLVARELLACGARSVCVSLGGDIHASGVPPEPQGWPVPLLHPVTGAPQDIHLLAGGGLAMSTVALRRWRRGSQELHHIVDPRTGHSCHTDLVAVAVAAASTARAEALAKVALILGADEGAALLRRCAVQGWLMTAERSGPHRCDAGGIITVGGGQ